MTITYNQLENIYIDFHKKEVAMYKARYLFWQALHKIKYEVKRTDGLDWKTFERLCRNLTKRNRRLIKCKKPRGTVCDHSTSIHEAFCLNWSVQKTCSVDNLVYIKRKLNLDKSILSQATWDTHPFD